MLLERAFTIAARIPHDKLLHFAVGVLAGALGLAGGLGGSIALPLALGVGKEIYDHWHPAHTADPVDLLATLLGALPVWGAWLLGRVA